MENRARPPSSSLERWLLLAGVGVVVGPAAVVTTVVALSVLVLDVTSGLTLVVGVVAFFAVAVATWYAAGRVGGAVTMRFGGSPFVALGLLVPSLVGLAFVAWSVVDDSRVLLGVVVFLLNALVLVVLGIRAAEQAAIRRLHDPGPPGRPGRPARG